MRQWVRVQGGKAMQRYLERKRVKVHYLEAGKPFQNGYGENVIGKFRDECLVGYEYRDVKEAREKIEEWGFRPLLNLKTQM